MTTRRPRRADDRLSVLVCRGCCCGTTSKHPDVDHAAHLADLRVAVEGVGGAKLFTVDCLDFCDRSNVVVVRSGGQRRWFGEMLDDGSIADLATWLGDGGGGPIPSGLAEHVFDPTSSTAIAAVMDHRVGAELTAWIGELLRTGGGWTMGVPGAIAEFEPSGAEIAATTDGTGVIAITDSGALRIDVSPDTRAFVVDRLDQPGVPALIVFARIDTAPQARHRIASLGLDVDAIRSRDREHRLFDLGIGRAAAGFAVRTHDEALIALLDGAVGRDWREAVDATELGAALVAASPDRVVLTNLGRLEVTSPIPPVDGRSPDGSHTHLLPGELELGADLPLGLQIPKGFVVGAIHYPRQG